MAEAPKYRLHQTSYIDGTVFKAGTVEGPQDSEGNEKPVYFVDAESKHIPGPHWEPMNDAAKAVAKANGIEFTGFVPDSVDKFARELEETLRERAKREAEHGNPDKMAAAMVSALMEAGVIPKSSAKRPAAAAPAEI